MLLTVKIMFVLNAIFFLLSGYWGFVETIWVSDGIIIKPHLYAGFFTVCITCAIHSIVMFYFIGSGKILKEALLEVYPDYFNENVYPMIRASKSKVFSWGTLSVLTMIIAGILGGAVSVGKVSSEVHLISILIATWITVKSFVYVLDFVKMNSEIMNSSADFIDNQQRITVLKK